MHQKRVQIVRARLVKEGIDAMLISNFYNIAYLTGFKTLTKDEREAFAFITEDRTYLFTDSRYLDDNLRSPNSGFQLRLIEPNKNLTTHLNEIITDEGLKSIGFEAEDLKFSEYEHLKQSLQQIDLQPFEKLIIRIREIKEEAEIERIAFACEVGDRCLWEITKTIKEETSEKEIARKIEFWLKEKNYDSAFDPIVAVDKNSSLPHYNTKEGSGIVKNGSIIMIDFGVKYEDYLSDITRIFFFGRPKDQLINTYNILVSVQEKTIAKIAEVKRLKDADEFCRRLISQKQLPLYHHSTGHGVGLEIHEYPKISSNCSDEKASGQVFTIEPGVYFEGRWGMRLEDTVLIDKDQRVKILTKFPKQMMILK